jgi:hypothetical protein
VPIKADPVRNHLYFGMIAEIFKFKASRFTLNYCRKGIMGAASFDRTQNERFLGFYRQVSFYTFEEKSVR